MMLENEVEEIIREIEELGCYVKHIKEEIKEGKKVGLGVEKEVEYMYNALGITYFYEFQRRAVEKIKEGKNVLISAPTASGKTEAFIYAALKNFKENKATLIIYPTKALSRDQLKRFSTLKLYGIRAEIYDGDTPSSKRAKIRENPPHILLTNFDMLHFILLNHKKFHKFFEKLETMIIDEFHTYTGVFGSHVGNIIRRAKRLLSKVYKKKLQIVLSSATIENPSEFSRSLIGEEFEIIKGRGRGKVAHHLIINSNESYLTTTLRIAKILSKKKIKSLIFANSHASVERLGLLAKNMGISARVYRAGFTKKEREKLEIEFKRDKEGVLISTSALELGIDIGDVNAVVLAGFAGTINSTKQRLGRAGRKGFGLAIFVARENPLDSYYSEYPELYIFKGGESCYANPNNEYILKPHLISMAKETLIKEGEIEHEELLKELVKEKLLQKFGVFYAPTKEGVKFARKISIRGIGDEIKIIYRGKIIGSREKNLAISELYEGAIYLHNTKFFISKGIDMEKGVVEVEEFNEEKYYTKPLSEKSAEIIEVYKEKKFGDIRLSLGKVEITNNVYGFLLKDLFSNTTLGEHEFETPYSYEMESNSLWIDFEELPEIRNVGEGLHAYEHVAISMSPLLTGSDDKELGGISYSDGRIYIYEGIPGGIGLVDVLFRRFEELARHTKKRLESCKCEFGCPKCILDPMCGNDNRFLSKDGGKTIAKFLIKELKKVKSL